MRPSLPAGRQAEPRLVLPALAALVASVACGPSGPSSQSGAPWGGTITTEGDTTTVITEAGSVWGGHATLVEEASIGVAAGDDVYMLDADITVFADPDFIYITNPEIPAVRVYDHGGRYTRTIGAEGQGPGEYTLPVYAAARRGRVYVFDQGNLRINVYGRDGASLDTWSRSEIACCIWPLSVSPNGSLRAPVHSWDPAVSTLSPRWGARLFDEWGQAGEVLWAPNLPYEPLTISVAGGEWEGVPFAPTLRWGVAPDGVVAGVSDDYRFSLLRDDGTGLIMQRYWQPVAVDPAHADWEQQRRVGMTRASGFPDWTWAGDEIPLRQPAFDALIPAASGEILVARSGPAVRLFDCREDPTMDPILATSEPCWWPEPILDVFLADGRYAGRIELPAGYRPTAQSVFVRGDLVLLVVEDEAGTVMVKRYRLVVPS